MRAQGVLSWVGQAEPGREPPRFEARLYDKLFNTSSVADTGDDWLEDLNQSSLTTVEGALATPRLAAAKAGDKCVHSCPRLTAQWQPCILHNRMLVHYDPCPHSRTLVPRCETPIGYHDEQQSMGVCQGTLLMQPPLVRVSELLVFSTASPSELWSMLLRFQLERLGFFCVDLDSMPGKLVVNRTCTLRADFIKE